MLLAQAALALQAPRAAALHLQPAPVAGTHAGCSRCPPVRAAYALDEDTSHLDDSCSSALTSGMDPKQLLSPVRADVDGVLRHEGFLPPESARLISGRFRQVLSFVLSYLESKRELRGVKVMISGGYVRDILLGRMSDDLDLTLDLRSCDPDMTVDAIAEGLPNFADATAGTHAIEEIEIVTALSSASRSKSVDAAQVRLRIAGEDVLVDLMPTIAREVYDAHDRIPRREGRGTAEQDTLRRDLTIGAILLEVVRPPPVPDVEVPDVEEQERGAAARALALQQQQQQQQDAVQSSVQPRNWVDLLERWTSSKMRSRMEAITRVHSEQLEQLEQSLAAAKAADLRFRLLDFHGGLDDLRARVLRAPYPRDLSPSDVWQAMAMDEEETERFETMLRDERAEALEARRGLEGAGEGAGADDNMGSLLGALLVSSVVDDGMGDDLTVGDGFVFGGRGGCEEVSGCEEDAADEQVVFGIEAQQQVLWWIKSLRDDPLRIVRTLRFAATLRFRVHSSFWRAVPFAVDALATKVSGPRKVAELHKIAKAGLEPLLDFFDMAFSPLAAFGTQDVAFGDALFGGPAASGESRPERISVTAGFDSDAMRTLAKALPSELCADARLGAVLAAAVISCDLRVNGPCTGTVDDEGFATECVLAGPPAHLGYQPDDPSACDAQMRACLEISTAEVERACAGLGGSTTFVAAAEEPLAIASWLLRRPKGQGQHALFAAAAADAPLAATLLPTPSTLRHDLDPPPAPIDGDEFAALLHVWEILKLDPAQAKRRSAVGYPFVLALLRTRCAQNTVDQIDLRVRLLCLPGPRALSGKAIAQLEGVPPHLRGSLMSQLHVLCRLRGDCPTLETAEQVREYLDGQCGGLLAQLEQEWHAGPDGELRECYGKKASSEWLRSGSS